MLVFYDIGDFAIFPSMFLEAFRYVKHMWLWLVTEVWSYIAYFDAALWQKHVKVLFIPKLHTCEFVLLHEEVLAQWLH